MYPNADDGIMGGGLERSGIPAPDSDFLASWSSSLTVAFGGVNGRES